MTETENTLKRIELALAKMEERAKSRDEQLAELKKEVHGLSRFRWVLLGTAGVGGLGSLPLSAELVKSLLQ